MFGASVARAIGDLNDGDYESARQSLHEIFIGAPQRLRPFFQGLMMLAIALNHIRRGEQPATMRMLKQAAERLEPFRPDFLGIDVDALLESIQVARSRALSLGVRGFAAFPRALITRVDLLPAGELREHKSEAGSTVYRRWQGSGPPIVLLHAPGHAAAIWQPVAVRLAAAFDVLAVDLPGHGASTWSGSFEAAEESLSRWLGAVATRPAGVIGVGPSSSLAIRLAAGAGVPAIVVAKDVPTGPRDAESARRRRAVWGTRYEVFEAYACREPYSSWRADLLWLYVETSMRDLEDGRVELRCPPEVEAAYLEASDSGAPTSHAIKVATSPLESPVAAAAAVLAALQS